MRKADIYFNGQIINTVEFDVINYTIYEKSIALTVKIDESNHKVVALVPYDHLIVIKETKPTEKERTIILTQEWFFEGDGTACTKGYNVPDGYDFVKELECNEKTLPIKALFKLKDIIL